MLSLDDDELRAGATLLTGVAADAPSVALGTVRLRARGLLSGPDTRMLAEPVAIAVGTWLWADDSVAITVQRRAAQSKMDVHRRGGAIVGHRRERIPDGEVHAFVGYPSVREIVDDVVAVLDAPEQADGFAAQTLQLEALERARHAAAAGDRSEVALALTDAGGTADTALIDALLKPRCIAHLVRERPHPSALTVLLSSNALWTFRHASAEDTTVRLDRPCSAVLREQIAQLWAT